MEEIEKNRKIEAIIIHLFCWIQGFKIIVAVCIRSQDQTVKIAAITPRIYLENYLSKLAAWKAGQNSKAIEVNSLSNNSIELLEAIRWDQSSSCQ